MDEEERERRKEMSKYVGLRGRFRLFGFMMGLWFLGLIIGLILMIDFNLEEIGIAVFWVFFITALAFPFVAIFWKPANSLMKKVSGNKNLSIHTIPLSTLKKLIFKKRPWYIYLLWLWEWLLLMALLYVVIKYFTK